MLQIASPKPVQPRSPLTAEDIEGDLIQPGHSLFGIVWVNPARVSGAPCFAGTRVPISNLFDYLEGGESLEEFLEGFPPVTREQAVAVLEFSHQFFGRAGQGVKILLDHCVDWRLSKLLSAHDVKTASAMGWERLRNGKLLASAAVDFEAVLTVDRNIRHEQNLLKLPIAVIVMIAASNRLSDLAALMPHIEYAIRNLRPRTLVEISLPIS